MHDPMAMRVRLMARPILTRVADRTVKVNEREIVFEERREEGMGLEIQ